MMYCDRVDDEAEDVGEGLGGDERGWFCLAGSWLQYSILMLVYSFEVKII